MLGQPARVPIGFVDCEGARHDRLVFPDGDFLSIDWFPARQRDHQVGRGQHIADIEQIQQVGLQRGFIAGVIFVRGSEQRRDAVVVQVVGWLQRAHGGHIASRDDAVVAAHIVQPVAHAAIGDQNRTASALVFEAGDAEMPALPAQELDGRRREIQQSGIAGRVEAAKCQQQIARHQRQCQQLPAIATSATCPKKRDSAERQ